jgi:transcriptional regulator CtsR
MKEPVPPTPVKEIMINHHKLGQVKLGNISKNELCRMVKQLIDQNAMANRNLQVMDMVLKEIKSGTVEEAKVAVAAKLKQMQEDAKKNSENSTPVK